MVGFIRFPKSQTLRSFCRVYKLYRVHKSQTPRSFSRVAPVVCADEACNCSCTAMTGSSWGGGGGRKIRPPPFPEVVRDVPDQVWGLRFRVAFSAMTFEETLGDHWALELARVQSFKTCIDLPETQQTRKAVPCTPREPPMIQVSSCMTLHEVYQN